MSNPNESPNLKEIAVNTFLKVFFITLGVFALLVLALALMGRM